MIHQYSYLEMQMIPHGSDKYTWIRTLLGIPMVLGLTFLGVWLVSRFAPDSIWGVASAAVFVGSLYGVHFILTEILFIEKFPMLSLQDTGEMKIYFKNNRGARTSEEFILGEFMNKDLTLVSQDPFGNLELKGADGKVFRLKGSARIVKSRPAIKSPERVYFLFAEEQKRVSLAYMRTNTLNGRFERSGGLVPMCEIQNPKLSVLLNKMGQQ